MKTVLIVIIGLLLWQSTDARKFTANVLQQASDFIEPITLRIRRLERGLIVS